MPGPISGNFKFGDTPPWHLMGWLGPHREQMAFEEYASKEPDAVTELSDLITQGLIRLPTEGPAYTHSWTRIRSVNNGQDLPLFEQETGDCVATSLKCAGDERQMLELWAGNEEKFRSWFAPWIYGISRNEIGGGINGAGSYGIWGAKAVRDYGVLFADDEGVPQYSGSIADRWGDDSFVYRKFHFTAKDNPIKTCRVRTPNDLKIALYNDMMCTIASWRGFEMRPRNYRGHHVFWPSGGWAHQMRFRSYMEDPFFAFYRDNTWGDAHGTPLNGEPRGGAWNLAEHLGDELDRGGVSIYAFYQFKGEPGEDDPGMVGD